MYDLPSQGGQILCPFGRILLAYQKDSVALKSHITIYVGKNSKKEAFDEISSGFLCSFLPEGEDYTRIKWPIDNQKVIVFDTGGIDEVKLKKFCLYLLRFDPSILFLSSEEYQSEIFKPTGSKCHG